MKFINIILIFLFSIQLIQSINNQFCSTLCQSKKCQGIKYNECEICATGFVKASANWADSCIVNPNVYYSTGEKYQPIGKTTDLAYDLKGNATVNDLTVTGAAYTGVCKNSGTIYDYKYYGDLNINSVLNIQHPGIIDNIYFWAVRIRYWLLRIDQGWWGTEVVTTFLTNPASPSFSDSMEDSKMEQVNGVCNYGNWERYKIIDRQFTFNQTATPLNFKINLKGSSSSNPWGIKQIVMMVRVCHPYCTACYGDSNTQCTQCNYIVQFARKSANKCALLCDLGYGNDTSNPETCIKCANNCTNCLDYDTNCLTCITNYLLYVDINATNVVACLSTCPSHYYANRTVTPNFCDICDSNCLTCSKLSTNCTTCYPNFYYYNNWCYDICPNRTYGDNATWKCVPCYNLCLACEADSTNCSECQTVAPNIAYLLNNTCLKNCDPGFFQDSNGGVGPNICTSCSPQCTTCDLNATYCFSCQLTFFLYQNSCGGTCPEPEYFPDNFTRKCLNCDIYCVGLTMKLYFKNNLKDSLILDLIFTQELDWNQSDIQSFVTISQSDPIIELSLNFDILYTVVAPKIYRIQVKPKGYIFIYNVTFQFKTMAFNGTYHRSKNFYPFKLTNYEQKESKTWFLIKTPSLSDTQNSIIDGVSKFSDQILKFTTAPYIQEIKKAGVFMFLFGGAQATSTACLVNNIPSQNMYEGVRFWASFVFFDVPQWQQNSDKTKYFVVPSVNEMVKNARLLQTDDQLNERVLFDTSNVAWRFQRTGHTSFFIFDVYMNIFLIVLCWILLIIGNYCIAHKLKYQQYMSKFYSFTHKIHQISIFYITLSTMLEWIYFDANSFERWLSLGICIFCNIYFLVYQLYIYYDMINYPKAKIGNKYYDYYVLKYGSLLKSIRFEEYDPKQPWSPKHWFRSYNFHIFSFYKKFLMMTALPIFYFETHAQISALIFIQVIEILRFLLSWPFKSKIRNISRFLLECCLLGFFVSVLIQGFMVLEIMKNNEDTLSDSINLYYEIGWTGFCLIFIFNIGHVIITIYDIVIGCRLSNRQLMDECRKNYYMQKINTYEEENQDVPLSLLNKWVKLGNLNDRNYDVLPDVNLRIQYFRIRKNEKGFEIQMKKIFEAFMNIQFNYQKEFNLTAGKKMEKLFTLRKQISPEFYSLIESLHNEYNSHLDFEFMTIKTFQKIIQSSLQPGERVKIDNEQMCQRIELQTYAGQTKTINLDKLLPGFPISKDKLIHLV